MDSDPKDEDAATRHVLDYYKKYSQNKDLPKYFSGASVSYLPEIKDVSPETERETSVKTNISIIVTAEEVNENVGEPIATSRASSPMSNHKLEWDSGADIGYSNCQEKRLRKSLSLPSITDLVQKKTDNDFGPVTSNVTVTRSQSSNSDGNVKVVLLTCSSSSEYNSDENNVLKKKVSSSSSSMNVKASDNIVTSSSSSSNRNIEGPNNTNVAVSSSDSSDKQSVQQFMSALSYLKQKIGCPDAHSTPKLPDERRSVTDDALSGTPMLKKLPNNNTDKQNTSKQVSSECKLIKEPCNLVVVPTVSSKEMVYEKREFCIKDLGKVVTNYPNQKIVNLALTKPITVECTCSNQNLKNKPPQIVRNQLTVAVQTDEVTEKELKQILRNSLATNNNQSLVYFEYSESDKNSARSTQTDSDIVESNCDSFEYVVKQPQLEGDALHKISNNESTKNLKRTQKTHDLRTNFSDENSEKSSSKEFCLGNLVSSGLLDNVEDDIGKSVYLLQRLLKSKKYDPVTKKRYVKKIIKKITESKYLEDSSTSSDLFVPKKLPKTNSTVDGNDHLLQSNIPWYPAGDQAKLSPRRKKLVQNTFTQDFIPNQHSSREEISSAPEIVPINSRDMRKNRFTLTNNEFSVNCKYETTEENKSAKTFSETDSTSLEKHYESSSTAKSYQNWKEDKTLSEKILEKRSHSSNGNGDCFVKLADKEREFQINWIDNEISHLGKLKGLLEKPNIDQRNPLNIQKTTNVYTVLNENDTPLKPKRNYIIETLIGTRSSSDMNFKLDGQVYTVHEHLNSKKRREVKRPRQVTGTIEVVSSDSTTNIKVITFCEECKRSPCICNLDKDEEPCACLGRCGSSNCICLNECLSKSSAPPCPYKTDSQNCCCKKLTSTCHFCKNCPCVCDTKYKDKLRTEATSNILGPFKPTVPSRPIVTKFSTFPSTSKEENRRMQNFMSSSREADVIDGTTSAASKISARSQKDDEASCGSLRKVFENCGCTQNNCTCDFVERLLNRFSKTNIPPTVCDNKCIQTNKNDNQSVGLQTQMDTNSQKQQTTSIADDKGLQTEKYMSTSESHTVGIQTWVNNQSESQQAGIVFVDAHTKLLKLKEDFQNIGIQTKADVRDQILQTSRSLDEQQNIVGTHKSTNSETQTKGVSFVDETTSPILRSAHTSPKRSTKQKDGHISPPLQSVSTSADNIKKHHDAITFPLVQSDGTSSDTKQRDAIASPPAVTSHTHSDSSRLTTSSKSSSSTSGPQTKKVICICCCTQTEPQVKKRARNVKVQIDNNGTRSGKDNMKRIGDSLTTSSATYEICPSILVSSYNDTSRSISEEDSSSKQPPIICVCCNEKYPTDKISVLGSKEENYSLCCNCLAKRPILTSLCYAGPEENCPCSKPSTYKTDTSNETTKRTATDYNEIEEYCVCTKPYQFKNSKYCSYCQFKLRNTAKSKNGIAYTLTLESDCLNKIRRRRKKMPLEEIRLKVPSPSKKKKHKDKENVSKRDRDERTRDTEGDKGRKCDCGRIICTSNCHVHGVSSKHRIDRNGLTLQEYLQKNRPDFIHSAETRRHVVLNSKSERVFEQVDAKLKFAEENMGQRTLKRPRKLFTEQEMKEITKRNYKKLPEVREKINNRREQRIRNADRYIVDVFARKIQRSVLKGKSSFPIDSNVICLPKTCDC